MITSTLDNYSYKTTPIPSKIILGLSNKDKIIIECGFFDRDKLNEWEVELNRTYHQILDKWLTIRNKK